MIFLWFLIKNFKITKFEIMSEIHIECPHCGSSFNAELHGDLANMMVFNCARCKVPLMYFRGEVAELDREEFDGLRKKLTRMIDAVVKDEKTSAAVSELKNMLETSNAIAEERLATQVLPLRKGSAPSEYAEPTVITDEAIDKLKQNLDSLDVDSFLGTL